MRVYYDRDADINLIKNFIFRFEIIIIPLVSYFYKYKGFFSRVYY